MAYAVNDSFTRPNGSLGSTPSGLLWTAQRGSVSILNGRLYANPDSDGSPYGAFATIDIGTQGQDATLSADVAYANDYEGGHSIYFRVVDHNNWWRFSVRRYGESYSYPTGGYTCNVYYNGSYNGSFQNDSDASRTYTDSNGNTTTYSCYQNYASGTSYYWGVRLEQCVNGSITTVSEANYLSVRPSKLRVRTLGNAISCFIDAESTARCSANSATHNTATRHGLGIWRSPSTYTNSLGMDNFQITPDFTGLYVPAMML